MGRSGDSPKTKKDPVPSLASLEQKEEEKRKNKEKEHEEKKSKNAASPSSWYQVLDNPSFRIR